MGFYAVDQLYANVFVACFWSFLRRCYCAIFSAILEIGDLKKHFSFILQQKQQAINVRQVSILMKWFTQT